MGRQRRPLSIVLPFEYVVVGRPHAFQNKTAAYTKWHDKARWCVAERVVGLTSSRHYLLSAALLRAEIVWLTAQPDARDHPDVDNIVKPLLDALEGQIIENDRQFRRVEATRVDVNRPGLSLPDLVKVAQSDVDYRGEVVWIWVGETDQRDGPEREWWL